MTVIECYLNRDFSLESSWALSMSCNWTSSLGSIYRRCPISRIMLILSNRNGIETVFIAIDTSNLSSCSIHANYPPRMIAFPHDPQNCHISRLHIGNRFKTGNSVHCSLFQVSAKQQPELTASIVGRDWNLSREKFLVKNYPPPSLRPLPPGKGKCKESRIPQWRWLNSEECGPGLGLMSASGFSEYALSLLPCIRWITTTEGLKPWQCKPIAYLYVRAWYVWRHN